jgi:hypothetical protein
MQQGPRNADDYVNSPDRRSYRSWRPNRRDGGGGGGDPDYSDDGNFSDARSHRGRQRRPQIDRRNLKLPKFKGKDVESWCSMVNDFAREFRWSEAEKRLHIKANLDDWIRSMFADRDDFRADEMLHQLTMRFGVNMSHPEVHNELMQLTRKPGEDLYSLADRVRNLARRAHMPGFRRQQIMRKVFFGALRTNSELQHWVDRYDNIQNPDMNLTLNLALEWERQHGTKQRSEKVRNVEDSSDTTHPQSETSTNSNTEETDVSVNKIDYISIKDLNSEDAKVIARHHNDTTRLLKKLAYTTLDDDKPKNSGQSSNRSSSSRSSHKSNRRSRSRTRKGSRRDRSRRRSYDKKKKHKNKKSKDRKDKKKDGKKHKNKDREKVENVRDESSDSRRSSSSSSSRSTSSEKEDTE